MTRKQRRDIEAGEAANPTSTRDTDSNNASREPMGGVTTKASPCQSSKHASATSMRSKRSTASAVVRRKQLELEATQAKAKIEMQLIDKQLEVDLAQLDAEEIPPGDDDSRVSNVALDEPVCTE